MTYKVMKDYTQKMNGHFGYNSIIIAKDINNEGAKKFKSGFKHKYEVLKFINEQPKNERCFHEVLEDRENRKIYFDFDKKEGEGTLPHINDFIHCMRFILPNIIKDLFNNTLLEDDILFTQSSVKNKASFHCIVPKYNLSVDNMKLIYNITANYLLEVNKELFGKLDGESCLDGQIYGRNQCFRIIGCHKMGKNNTKELYTSNFLDTDAFVGVYKGDDSIELKLIKNLQSRIDKQNEKTQLQRALKQTTYNKANSETLRKIVMNLNRSRSDNYKDWYKVCLALGYEQSGLNIALEFTNRADKPNERAATTLYEKGTERSNNSVKIGSLMYMLKEDNPQVFKEVVSELAHKQDVKELLPKSMQDTDCKFDFGDPNETFDDCDCDSLDPCEFCLSKTTPHDLEGENIINPDGLNQLFKQMLETINSDKMDEYSEKINNYYLNKYLDLKNIVKNTTTEKETQEEKVKRWLGNPEYWLFAPINNTNYTLNCLGAEQITYAEEYMKPYPDEFKTAFVKAPKGGGKTYQLEKYIEKHNPEYCVFVSFRRTFSKEINKRLSKLGFEMYSDIQGGIDDKHKRIIIQVESIHRIKWLKKCDLFVCDEIESIRSQLFAPTVKFRAAVFSRFISLVKHSNKAMFLDADISDNTIKLITRERTHPCHWIENIYNKKQSKFQLHITTKKDKFVSLLSKELEAGKRVVIPSNRSVEMLESIRNIISEKFPNKKIQLYNSKSSVATREELNDVEKSWVNYDVVIYSPTISAGVSFDLIHFDSCFAWFSSGVRINSLRQMLNRVRKFKSDKFVYCLQQIGGCDMPDNVRQMEEYICSSRFIDTNKPDVILSRDTPYGEREYPFKGFEYYAWIYNETEKARDKNLFVFNFLREEWHAGITNIKWIDDIKEEELKTDKVKFVDIKTKQKELKMTKWVNIANANIITFSEKLAIEEKMNKEQAISENEVLSLKRFNLLNSYDLDQDKQINSLFVDWYDGKSTRNQYKLRKNVKKYGFDGIAQHESDLFNGLFLEEVNITDDLNRRYVAKKMIIAKELLIDIAGYKSFEDDGERSKGEIMRGFVMNRDNLNKNIGKINKIFHIPKRQQLKFDDNGDLIFKTMKTRLGFINRAIGIMGLKVKETKRRSGKYTITGLNKFYFGDDAMCMKTREEALKKMKS